jgi:N-acetylmuramoyl-L-alanine amidase
MDVDAKMIDRWHRQKGWLMIGYHKVIKRDGTVEDGRPLDMIGAHVEGYNHDSIGICMAGGLDHKGNPENNFTPAQWDSLKALLVEFRKDYSGAQILGHRDFPKVAKACPSFDVKEWLKTWL